MTKQKFQVEIRDWYRKHGRHDLPWRKTRDPYRILVSEVMLQQTQVARVIPKYREFLHAFPTIQTLSHSPLAIVLRVWQGMGYNRRAAYLKRLAHMAAATHGGRIPADPTLLRRLPGIGGSTAGAVCTFAFGRRTPFLETNIRRVYLHHFFPRRRNVGDREILRKIAATMPQKNIREWYYALMDYGALALKEVENPNRRAKIYSCQPPFAGSRRELRGRIMAAVIREGTLPLRSLVERLGREIKHPHRKRCGIERNALLPEGARAPRSRASCSLALAMPVNAAPARVDPSRRARLAVLRLHPRRRGDPALSGMRRASGPQAARYSARAVIKTPHPIRSAVAALAREGLLVKKDGRIAIPR